MPRKPNTKPSPTSAFMKSMRGATGKSGLKQNLKNIVDWASGEKAKRKKKSRPSSNYKRGY